MSYERLIYLHTPDDFASVAVWLVACVLCNLQVHFWIQRQQQCFFFYFFFFAKTFVTMTIIFLKFLCWLLYNDKLTILPLEFLCLHFYLFRFLNVLFLFYFFCVSYCFTIRISHLRVGINSKWITYSSQHNIFRLIVTLL